MAVIAFVDGTSWTSSVIEHAAWAAKTLDQPLTVVVQEEWVDTEPMIAYDAYQHMSTREEMLQELTGRSRTDFPGSDGAAIEMAQSAARRAKELGAKRVRTTTTTESFLYFIENHTGSGDLLIIARHDNSQSQSRQWLDQFLRVRSRVMLLVPETFAPVESWLIAIDGKPAIGRAVDFLSSQGLVKSAPATAVFVGNDYQSRLHFRDAVRHLQSTGHTVKSHELQGNADDVLAAVLEIQPVDMLVMGAYGQGRFRLLTERSTTSRLLKSFRGPVLVAKA